MKAYIALYTGEQSNRCVKISVAELEGRPRVILVVLDITFDDDYQKLRDELRHMGYECEVKSASSKSFHEIANALSAVCKELELEAMKNQDKIEGLYLEVGGLDPFTAGAVFTAAYNNSGTVVYWDEFKGFQKVKYQPLPKVSNIHYRPQKTLDVLYENGSMNHNTIARMIYADQIVMMDEEERKEFFSKNHNTYKIIDDLSKKGWISLNRETKEYSLTEMGNLARIMADIQNEKKRQKRESDNQ